MPTTPNEDLLSREDYLREREALLADIRMLAAKLERLGVNLRTLKNTARAIELSSQPGGRQNVPTELLEALRRELAAILREFRGRERTHGKKVSRLRWITATAALAALLGGVIVQRGCDPIGKVHAYLTTPVDPETAP